MKKLVGNLITKIGLLGVMALVTAVIPAQGQSLAYRIKARIPFDFNVADKKLPAGEYSVGRVRQNSDDLVLSIADLGGRSKAIRSSIPVQSFREKKNATLVFHRYGDQYFLFQVWGAGETTGRQFLKSRSERELQANIASNSSMKKVADNAATFETVTLVGVLE